MAVADGPSPFPASHAAANSSARKNDPFPTARINMRAILPQKRARCAALPTMPPNKMAARVGVDPEENLLLELKADAMTGDPIQRADVASPCRRR
ncbi:hypothetical protein [Sorangium sp. So ce854]|uniref:hypothetical protein n=1 Tax=Sorangium sp. So ce854 TaxID=3133322 RepID=UPI003F5FBD05